MAKGIDINGQLRGKRGGVVYYRTNGQQISRARNFAPKNPKTDKQLIQRAVTATIAQMYSEGKMIFDHSFEGKAVPAGSMREFMKLNMNALRAAIIADINGAAGAADPAEYEAGLRHYVVNPSRDTPTPGQYIISKGTYKDSPLTLVSSTAGSLRLDFPAVATGMTTVAAYLAAYNLLEGDIHTVCFLTSKTSDFSRVSSPTSHFGFIRLMVKSGIDGTADLATAKVSDIFEVEAYHAAQAVVTALAAYVMAQGDGVSLDAVDWIDAANFQPSAAGIICSRDDEKLRSNTVMIVIRPDSDTMENWSVTGVSLVESWRNASGDVQSDLILEGGNF